MTYRQTPMLIDVATMPVVRRKGHRVRRFDPVTARFTGWLRDDARVVEKITRPMDFYALSLLTVAMLKKEATDRGIPFKSKARKGDLIAALAGHSPTA